MRIYLKIENKCRQTVVTRLARVLAPACKWVTHGYPYLPLKFPSSIPATEEY